MTCQDCHGGPEPGTFKTAAQAHTGLVDNPNEVCGACHAEQELAMENSMHANLWGERAAIEARAGITLEGSPHERQFEGKCGSCHATCGQCHVTRPKSVGGGFPKIGAYYSHRFSKTPDMNEQCTACHGSRIGTDFKGELEGNLPDIHRSKGYKCEFCHKAEEMHGDGQYTGDHYNHRYEVATMPRCEDCHQVPPNAHHSMHVNVPGRNLQCQVCHSQPYKNCTNCHNLADDFDIDPSRVQLKIARNPSPYRTEYDYVLVRHVPVDPGTFADWGLDLPNYLSRPTWQYTSPHNIRRVTAQAIGCDTCHDSPDGPNGYFLRESDLYEDDGVTKLPDYDANIGIVVPDDTP